MSRAGSAIKVLRTAINRVQKRWGKGDWSTKGPDGEWYVCMEGAITGGCSRILTPQQLLAIEACLAVIKERYRTTVNGREYPSHVSIPSFNDDPDTTQDMVLEVLKLALIKLETGWPEEDYIDEDETKDIVGEN